MKVARQFIAWNPFNRDPSRRERSDPYPRLINARIVARLSDPIIPFPTGRFSFLHIFQALKCLATIIQSLRDDSSSGISWILRAKFLPASKMP